MNYTQIIDASIAKFNSPESKATYPMLHTAAVPLAKPSAPILGRDMSELRLALRNPEKANVILLGEPGSGKTAFMQGFTYDQQSTQYLVLSVDIERFVKDSTGDKDTEMANGLMDFVSETAQYSKDNDIIVILFIDEFHRIAMVSPSAVEALKPILEKSAHNGFRVVAATTFEEYDEWISPNRALDQRLLRITLPELPKEAVINILKSRAKQYNVLELADEAVFGEIYDTSRRILISNSQPRASIDILLNCIGNVTKVEYMKDGKLIREYATPEELGIHSDYPLSRPMLNRVIQRSYGIDIDNQVSIPKVKEALRTKILNQEQAVKTIISRLELSLTGFNDPTRPKISFLSTGATGTGKCLDNYVPIPTPDGYKLNGDLQVGDYVFNRKGEPVEVIGVYPQGERTVYRVTLTDGRSIECSSDHLWTYKSKVGNGSKRWKTVTTKELMGKNLALPGKNNRTNYGFVLPMNGPTQLPVYEYDVDPYLMGSLIGDGYISNNHVEFITSDIESVEELSRLLGLPYSGRNGNPYAYHFITGQTKSGRNVWLKSKDLLQQVPELIGKKSYDKFIPEIYKLGSVEQRWALIQGLFDTDGHISSNTRYNVSFSTVSERLALDVQEVLWSLGIMTSITSSSNKRKDRQHIDTMQYKVHVKVANHQKEQFFRLSRKRALAQESLKVVKQREKTFDVVSIKSIEKLDYKKEMTCIMIDDPEHLYQAGKEHIVTHNTELAKVITEELDIPLKRFDMSRYPRPEDAVEFANQLAQAAWSAPNGYILIDEVEKSSREAMNILLQVLDDARLTAANNPNRVISFTGNIINLTTNLASEVFQHAKRFGNQQQDVDIELVYQALANSDVFETAVLGRIDVIVPFKPLPDEAMNKIAQKELQFNIDIVETPERRIMVSKDIIPYIVKDRTSKDTERGGARDAKRNIKNIVIQKLATYLADEPDEVPIILRLDGVARFRDTTVADPLSADVILVECYPRKQINSWLSQLSTKVNKPLVNAGLFIPKDTSPQMFVQEIVELVKQGYTKFKTEERDTYNQTEFVTVGVK